MKKTQREHHQKVKELTQKNVEEKTTTFADEWKKLKEDTIDDIIGIISAHNKNEGKEDDKLKPNGGENGELRTSESDTHEKNDNLGNTGPKIANEKIKHLEKGKGFRKEVKDLRTYDEIVAENDYLGKRVVELLALVAEMEYEKKKTKELDEEWICSLIAERDEQCEIKRRYMEQLEACKKKIKELEDEQDPAIIESGSATVLDNDRTTGSNSTMMIENNVIERRDNNSQAAIPNQDRTNDGNGTKQEDLQGDVFKDRADSGIEIDLDAVTQEIKGQVEILVHEKLSNLGIKTIKETYLTKPVNNTEEKISRGILHTNINLENSRDLNIIIHGINENKKADNVFIKELFGIMEMDTLPTIAHRLGRKKEHQARPIKIAMESRSHKAEFMSKLSNLKYAGPVYNKARVTDDHSWEERQEIRRWVKMAKEKNEKDGGMTNYLWKVRGTPSKTNKNCNGVKEP